VNDALDRAASGRRLMGTTRARDEIAKGGLCVAGTDASR
jgi:hypothetical protein